MRKTARVLLFPIVTADVRSIKSETRMRRGARVILDIFVPFEATMRMSLGARHVKIETSFTWPEIAQPDGQCGKRRAADHNCTESSS